MRVQPYLLADFSIIHGIPWQPMASHELMVQPTMHRRRQTAPEKFRDAAQGPEAAAAQQGEESQDDDGLSRGTKATELMESATCGG